MAVLTGSKEALVQGGEIKPAQGKSASIALSVLEDRLLTIW